MLISDLSYLEPIAEATAILGGAGVNITATAQASGALTSTTATTTTFAQQLPLGGSVAIGTGRTSATASDPIDAAVSINVTGTADGVITKVVTNTYIIDLGSEAKGGGNVVAVGITPPSP